MSRYSDTIRDEFGRAVPGVQIYVYDWDVPSQATGSLTSITDDDTITALPNPLTSDEFGDYYFNWQSGSILLELHYGGKLQSRELIRENASDLSLRTDLAAVGGSALVTFDKTQAYTAGTVGASLNGLYGTFTGSPNYVGVGSDSTFIVAQGSATTPSTTQGSVTVFQKAGNSLAFNTLTAIAFKHSSAANARATAFFSEATDKVGGIDSFVEGARPHGILLSGANGSAYGVVAVAGTAASGPTTPKFLIGSEAVVNNQIGPADAPAFTSFDKTVAKVAYNATNGSGIVTAYKADAAYLTNPFSVTPFRTGLLLAEGSVDHTGIAGRVGLSIVTAIDFSLATVSGFFLKGPNNVPSTARNAANSADLEVWRVDGSNVLQLGAGTVSVASAGDLNLASGKVLKANGTQVVTARKTGWAVDTGTAKRTANATYAAGTTLTYSASYVQAEQTAMATRMAAVEAALQNAMQTIKALKDDMHSASGHGLIGT